ncbi:MAG: PepSY domain-containing protein [bacterium]|nr:PepSY domain-containing protein [bacterium]
MSAASFNRKVHRWGAILFAVPVLVIFATGALLQLKKDWSWIQPPAQRGDASELSSELSIGWDDVLSAARGVEAAEVASWADIDRLDVRPGRGLIKIRCANRWELQIDSASGEVLSSTYRRSDLIEAIHDGSWFHDSAKLWIFLPSAVALCGLWGTGAYLWFLPHMVKRRRKHKKVAR